VGAILLGHRSERVRRHGLRLRKLVADRTDVSDVEDQILDPAFDLPAWIAAQSGEDRKASTGIALGGAVPTYSRLFKIPELASPLSRPIAIPSGMRMAAPSLLPSPPSGVALAVPAPPGSSGSLRVRGRPSVDLGDVTRIGRRPDSDLVVADPLVSGTHAEVRSIDGVYVLADAGSRNGTFLNDTQVMEPMPLSDGDVVRVGDTEIVFSTSTAGVAPSPPIDGGDVPVGALVSGLLVMPDALEVPPPPEPTVAGVLEGAGRRFELLGSVVSIGRDPSADISLRDPAVSGTHAQIAEHDGRLYLRDLGSRNGTYANRRLVSEPHLLADGDVIHVGDTDLTFRVAEAATAPPAVPAPAPLPGDGERAPSTPAAPPTEPVAPVPPPPQQPATAAIPPAPEISAPAPRGEVRLIVESGPLVGLAFRLSPPSVLVGRDPEAEVSLSEPTVSWRHARLTAHGPAWTIVDLGSTNGTRVNGDRIEPERQIPIDPGAEVRFGEITLRFEAV
jgi:pSer/pThr/pTyr-binding forkhead associated (FHA) protein